MGITKNHIHTKEQIELARLFKALGHPARIAIVENLLKHKGQNCNNLRTHIQLAQSTISGHIKELHDVGILSVVVIGSNAYYEINKIALEQVSNYMEELYQQIDGTFIYDRLWVYTKPLQYLSRRSLMNQT